MISLKSKYEIECMRDAGRVVGEIIKNLSNVVAPGVTTKELENLALYLIKRNNARSAFLGYRGYPAAICTSVNEQVVHGIPSAKKVLKAGDIISIDVGVELGGFCADAAATVGVGKISTIASKLMATTKQALFKAIAKMSVDNRIGDLSHEIQEYAKKNGFGVVKTFVGHGIGRQLHEDPEVPNFGPPHTGPVLKEGVVLAIEPMVVEGAEEVLILQDDWTVVTKDRKLAAHFEHTVALTDEGPCILTSIENDE